MLAALPSFLRGALSMSYLNILVETLAANIWPLSFLLVALVILRRIRDDVRPIFLGMVAPLTKQAQTNAVAWTVGIMLGILSSLGALTEVANTQHWVFVANFCKVLGPGLATIVALIKQSPMPPPSQTTPPFGVANPPDNTKPSP